MHRRAPVASWERAALPARRDGRAKRLDRRGRARAREGGTGRLAPRCSEWGSVPRPQPELCVAAARSAPLLPRPAPPRPGPHPRAPPQFCEIAGMLAVCT